MNRKNIDWSKHGDEIVELYVSGLSVRDVISLIEDRHGERYHSGTLTNYLGRRGVSRSQAGSHKLIKRKLRRICELCGEECEFQGYNQRWCNICMGGKRYQKRVGNYGLPAIIIERAFEKQNGKCAICQKQFDDMFQTTKKRKLNIDHDHVSQQFRGLLCVRCNSGLSFVDRIGWLEAAQRYISAAKNDPNPIFINPRRKRKYVNKKPVKIV